MAYGKIKADAFIYDDNGSDTEITAATIASNSSKAPTASPAFTGTPTAPTAAANTDTTQIATTAYVKDQVGQTAVITAQRSMTERTITTSAFDLATGNLWTCGAIAIPNPTNCRWSSWRHSCNCHQLCNQWDHPGGAYTAPTAFPAIAPFFAPRVINSCWVAGRRVLLNGKYYTRSWFGGKGERVILVISCSITFEAKI